MKTLSWLGLGGVLTFIGLCSHRLAEAATAVVVPDDASFLDLLRPVYEALTGGQYAFGTLLLIVAAVALAKKYVPIAWLHTDTGGSVLVAVGTTAAALAASVAAPGAHLTTAGLVAGFKAGLLAAGGYAFIKNVIITPLLPRLPAWLQKLLTPILWVFDGRLKPADVKLSEAIAAGDKAIGLKPSQGISAIVSTPTDVL